MTSSYSSFETNKACPIHIDENGTLSGYVTDSAMNPIEGAKVRVYFHETYEENYTDSSGYYHVTNIPICNCTKNATASKEGYTTEWVLLAIGENTTLDFVLTLLGNTLYVGGSGAGNYSRIQDAVNNASDGDTVYVFNGVYYEQLTINTSVILLGENKNTTIIDGNNTDGNVITIYADDVTISGFTIQNSGRQIGDSGVVIYSDYDNIKENIICNNGYKRYYFNQGGIILYECSHNRIENNLITKNRETGIYLHFATNNTIQNNILYDNTYLGVVSNGSSYNQIIQNEVYENICGMTYWPYSSHNTISNNYVHEHPGCGIAIKMYSDYNIIQYNKLINNLEWGLMLGFGPTQHTTVEYNMISGTTGGQQNWFDGTGLVVSIAYFNTIRYNNFIENKYDVYLENSLFNKWEQNYWDTYSGNGPKIIKGHFAKPYTYHPETKIPWFALDWFPAKEPYDI